jgi:hypothetical protein
MLQRGHSFRRARFEHRLLNFQRIEIARKSRRNDDTVKMLRQIR